MRITAVCHFAFPGATPAGGADTMMADLLQYLVNQGWEAQVIMNHAGRRINHRGIEIYPCTTDAQRLEIAKGSDVLITHLGGTPVAKDLGKALGVPVAQLIHNTSQYTIGFLGSGCDLAIYNTKWVQDFHEAVRKDRLIKYWQRPGRSVVLERATREWPGMICRPPAVEHPQLPTGSVDGKITLINLVPNKGPDIFYALAEANPTLEFRGVIGGYERAYQVTRDLPNVEIYDHTTDMQKVYSEASVVIVPSKYESYGRVAVEAMAQGVPVLASPTPGLMECLGNHQLIVEDRNVLSHWQAGLKLILGDYDYWSRAALRRYRELQIQTKTDLRVFEEAMVGLCAV